MLKSFGSGITCLLSDGNSYIQAGRQTDRQADINTCWEGRLKIFQKGRWEGVGLFEKSGDKCPPPTILVY